MQSIPANEIFQKVDARQIGMMVRFYRAADVDALLADVRRLVEAGKYRDNIDNTCRDGWDIFRAKVDLKEAIAAVERHLLKE